VTRPEIEQFFKDHPEAFQPLKDAVEISHILLEVGRSRTAEERAGIGLIRSMRPSRPEPVSTRCSLGQGFGHSAYRGDAARRSAQRL